MVQDYQLYQLPSPLSQLSTVNYQLSTINCQLSTINYQLSIMSYVPENALIVQSDRSILLEVHAPTAQLAREAIAPFAELIKSPEHIHTYRITPLSVWNARAAGMLVELMIAALRKYAKYDIPESVAQEIALLGTRYGLTVIERIDAENTDLQLRIADRPLTELQIGRASCRERVYCVV